MAVTPMEAGFLCVEPSADLSVIRRIHRFSRGAPQMADPGAGIVALAA
jgi:hypothetical protein